LLKAARRGPVVWADLARAVAELAIANRRLSTGNMRELIGPARTAQQAASPGELTDAQRRLVARVAYAVPVMGLRVPWRSDCLVQALAAKRWLIPTSVDADSRWIPKALIF
jgi:hypothetical protein